MFIRSGFYFNRPACITLLCVCTLSLFMNRQRCTSVCRKPLDSFYVAKKTWILKCGSFKEKCAVPKRLKPTVDVHERRSKTHSSQFMYWKQRRICCCVLLFFYQPEPLQHTPITSLRSKDTVKGRDEALGWDWYPSPVMDGSTFSRISLWCSSLNDIRVCVCVCVIANACDIISLVQYWC